MLPASGEASPDQRKRLDVTVRKALEAQPGVKVQPQKVTGEQLSMFIDLNAEVCDNDDLVCLSKFGILAEVESIVIIEAAGQRTLDVKLVLVNVEKGSVVRTIAGEARADDAPTVVALVARLFQKEEVVRIIDTAPTDQKPRVIDDAPPPDIERGDGVDESKLNDLQFAGVTVASVGGGIAALGLLGALSCEAIFWTGTGPAKTRADVVAPLGSVLWVVGVVGGLGAAAGGGLYLAGAPPTDDEPRRR